MSIPTDTVQQWNMELIRTMDVAYAAQAIMLHNHAVLASMLNFEPSSE